MAKTLQFKRYPTANLANISGAPGELIVDSTQNTITVHDGVTSGGWPLATQYQLSANVVTINSNISSNVAYLQGGLNTANANTIYLTGVNVSQNANIIGAFTTANSASANTVYLQGALATANANTVYLSGALATANANIAAAFTTANNAIANLGPIITVNSASYLYIPNATPSTSNTTGALVVTGGVGITGNVYIGGRVTIAGNTTIENVNITNFAVNTTDIIIATNTTPATANATGTLQVSGGAWVGGNVYVGNAAVIAGNTTINGSVLLGTTYSPNYGIHNSLPITGATSAYSQTNDGTIQSGVTTYGAYYATVVATAAASFTVPNLVHYQATQGTFGAGSTVTTQTGFSVDSSLTGATNNYAYYGGINSGTNRYNLNMAGTAINYLAGNLGVGVSPSTTANVLIGAGTTNSAPLRLTSGTNLATAVAGSVEWNGYSPYFTPSGTQRSILQASQYYELNVANTLSSVATAQSALGLTTGVALSASTVYEFELLFNLVTSGTTSHTEAFGFVYSGTTTNYGYQITRMLNGTTTPYGANTVYSSSATPTVVTTALTTAQNATYLVKGIVNTSTAGNLNPTITFSAGPGGTSTISVGAYMKISPIAASPGSANTIIGTWV